MNDTMEKKSLRDIYESQELEPEDLENVAGGLKKQSPEEYQRYMELRNKFDMARVALANGTGSQAEMDSAREEMLAYIRSTCS